MVGFIPLSESFLAAKNISSATWLGLPPLLLATLPPLIGITLAIVTRRLVTSLAIGVAFAALFAGGPSPLAILEKLFVDYFIKVLFSPFHIALLVFTIALIGMVGVATRSGGTQGIVNIVLRVAKGVRGARVATVLMGFIVFFDGYANTAIVGPTVQPLFDKLKISRAKLAYIIDSTAAPIAGLAIVSTWIGTEVGYLQEAAHSVGVMQSGYALFFSAMPFRFYCIFTLLVVILIAWSGRDFGPMVDAERDAQCNIPRPTSPPGEPPNPDFIS
ncbi:Na+/H+ antiporter NhaC family protein, partial [Myxococcota bacterium]|nr:Na+/H+ antiporter NhaC family protein [Myxococcota bacterium]